MTQALGRPAPGAGAQLGIAGRLEQARSQLTRVHAVDVPDRLAAGAVLVDIRPSEQRSEEGAIPGALVIERNVLEWRFDPASEGALPIAAYDLEVIVICQQGYASSLAAESLQQVGITRATDVIDGHDGWRDAGLG